MVGPLFRGGNKREKECPEREVRLGLALDVRSEGRGRGREEFRKGEKGKRRKCYAILGIVDSIRKSLQVRKGKEKRGKKKREFPPYPPFHLPIYIEFFYGEGRRRREGEEGGRYGRN